MLASDLEDFNPTWDLLAISGWLLQAADFCEILFANHPKKTEFCKELRQGAVAVAHVHGMYSGAVGALRPAVQLSPDAQVRVDHLLRQYTIDRAAQIERICQLYLRASVMVSEVNLTPGRPRLRLPDYEALKESTDPNQAKKIVQYAFEFSIAVQLADTKHETGKYTGLQKLLTEAVELGNLDDTGDTAQRIKRLARQIYKDRPLYLTPGLHAARRDALLFIYSAE